MWGAMGVNHLRWSWCDTVADTAFSKTALASMGMKTNGGEASG